MYKYDRVLVWPFDLRTVSVVLEWTAQSYSRLRYSWYVEEMTRKHCAAVINFSVFFYACIEAWVALQFDSDNVEMLEGGMKENKLKLSLTCFYQKSWHCKWERTVSSPIPMNWGKLLDFCVLSQPISCHQLRIPSWAALKQHFTALYPIQTETLMQV